MKSLSLAVCTILVTLFSWGFYNIGIIESQNYIFAHYTISEIIDLKANTRLPFSSTQKYPKGMFAIINDTNSEIPIYFRTNERPTFEAGTSGFTSGYLPANQRLSNFLFRIPNTQSQPEDIERIEIFLRSK